MNKIIVFLTLFYISAIIYNQGFKISINKSNNIISFMSMISILSGIFSLIFIPFFKFKFILSKKNIILFALSCILYAIVDRLNVVVRKNIEVSTFSILKQISNIFMTVLGFLIYKEEFILKKFIGIVLIFSANFLVLFEKGSLKLDKYILLSILSNFIFSFTLFININVSQNINIPLYVFFILFIPGMLIKIFNFISFKSIINEIKKGKTYSILLTCLFGSLMLISQLELYTLSTVTLIAPLCTITVLFNAIFSYFLLNERNKIYNKLIASVVIIFAIFLIKG